MKIKDTLWQLWNESIQNWKRQLQGSDSVEEEFYYSFAVFHGLWFSLF